jgi:hypothetical protein
MVIGSANCEPKFASLFRDHANQLKTAQRIYFYTFHPAQISCRFVRTLVRFVQEVKAMSGRTMISGSQYRVAIRAGAGGRYTYQLFTLAGEPRTFLADDTDFDSPQEAERAGYEALERLDSATIAEAMPARVEPSSE